MLAGFRQDGKILPYALPLKGGEGHERGSQQSDSCKNYARLYVKSKGIRFVQTLAPLSKHGSLVGMSAFSFQRAVWKFTGADRVRYLNGQVTNDISKLTEEIALYAAVCTHKGKMDGDVWVRSEGDVIYVDADIELRDTLGPRLEKYIIADDVEVEDLSEALYLTHYLDLPSSVEGSTVKSFRLGQWGTDLWSTSSSEGDSNDGGAARVRIGNGFPLWGVDMSEDTLPPEVGFEHFGIKYDKGCYIGQEVISRLKSIGRTNKELRVIQFPSESLPEFPHTTEAGVVTSGFIKEGFVTGLAKVARKLFPEEGGTFKVGEVTVNEPASWKVLS